MGLGVLVVVVGAVLTANATAIDPSNFVFDLR